MKAVVLASGGLDSAVTAAAARQEGHELYFLTIAYGQRHAIEVDAARRLAEAFGAREHRVVAVDLRVFGGSALTADLPVPTHHAGTAQTTTIPITYVPARNTIFLSLALAYAETLLADAIYLGANIVDYSGYPDCRPEYLEAFERIARLGTRLGVEGKAIEIRAPLLRLSKAEIIRLGVCLGVPIGMTHSCYDPDPDGAACGECDSCHTRQAGFEQAGIPDPTPYRGARAS